MDVPYDSRHPSIDDLRARARQPDVCFANTGSRPSAVAGTVYV
jgi:hypothetical protein